METYADKVRAALVKICRNSNTDTVTAAVVAAMMGLETHKAKQPLYATISDMKRRGELVPVGTGKKGVYRYVPVKKNYLRTVMWRLLRSRRKITVEDLQELAGASASYAREWIKMLEKREIVKEMDGGGYRLIEDTVEEPVNIERIEKLRNWREQRKQALTALDKASAAINQAKKTLRGKD